MVALQALGPSPWLIQPTKATDLRGSLAVLNHGGPLLMRYLPGTHTPRPVGVGDAQGIYVIAPLLSHWLGARDPVSVVPALWIGCLGGYAAGKRCTGLRGDLSLTIGWVACARRRCSSASFRSASVAMFTGFTAWVTVTFHSDPAANRKTPNEALIG